MVETSEVHSLEHHGERGSCRIPRSEGNEVTMLGDNNAANLIGANQSGLRKVRHLSLADLFIREAVASKGYGLQRVDSVDNPSDIGTKVLPDQKLAYLRSLMCLQTHEPANRSDDEKYAWSSS